MGLRYEGVKKGYPRLRKRFGKLVGYVQLCRPFTLLAPLMAGLFGVLSPVRDLSLSHLITAAYVGITLAFSQAVGQCLNQYADVELDKIVKPYRPLPLGVISREEALGLSWLLAIFAMGRAFTISTFFGLVILTLLFFAVFYSMLPLSPRKLHPLVNTGWLAVSRGFLPMLAVWSIYGDLSRAFHYSIFAFLWVMGFQSTKDVPDAEGDKKFGIQTIPNSYGLKGLAAILITCTVLYASLAICLRKYLLLSVLPLALLAVLTIKRQTEMVENTIAWCCFYLGLGLIYVLMFLSERLTLPL